MWLITLLVLHNLIIKIEEKHGMAQPGIWVEDGEGGEGGEENDSDDDDDDDGDGEGEGEDMEDDDGLTPGKAFRLHLFRILEQRGFLG
jgi:hypothetical protein